MSRHSLSANFSPTALVSGDLPAWLHNEEQEGPKVYSIFETQGDSFTELFQGKVSATFKNH